MIPIKKTYGNARDVISLANQLIKDEAWQRLLPKRTPNGKIVLREDDSGKPQMRPLNEDDILTLVIRDVTQPKAALLRTLIKRFTYPSIKLGERSFEWRAAIEPNSTRRKFRTGSSFRFTARLGLLHYLGLLRSYLEVLSDTCPGILKGISKSDLLGPCRALELTTFVASAKHVCAYPMAMIMSRFAPNPFSHEALPEKGQGFYPNTFFDGVLGHRINRMLRVERFTCPSLKVLRVGMGVLFAKRGCLPVPDTFIKKTLESHKVALTKIAPVLSDALREKLCALAKQLAALVIPDVERCSRECQKVLPPRVRASHDTTRSEGGHVAAFIAHSGMPVVDGDTALEPVLLYGESGFQIGRKTDLDWQGTLQRALANDVYDPVADFMQLSVKVKPILEPLKVRTITAGESFEYTMSTGLQKALSGRLAKLMPFRLTGQTVTREVINGLRKIGDLWVSGDYSAATDKLSIHVTKIIFEAILARLDLPHGVKTIYRRVLYEQQLEYPPGYGITPADQANGQLMGSPLSFPILCMANMLCYFMARQELEPDLSWQDVRDTVLINGDDIAFSCDARMYESWSRMLLNFGFEKSLGKNYVNPHLLTINSTLWRMSDRVQIKHLNVGFLTGQGRTTGREETKYAALSAYWNNLLEDGDPAYRWRIFKDYNIDEINKLSRNGLHNLFLPLELGGAGFRGGDKVGNTYTDLQKAVASRIYERITEQHDPDFAIPSVVPIQAQHLLYETTGEDGWPIYWDSYGPRNALRLDVSASTIVHAPCLSRQIVFEPMLLPKEVEEQCDDVVTLDNVHVQYGAETGKVCQWPSWARSRVNRGNWSVDAAVGFDWPGVLHISNRSVSKIELNEALLNHERLIETDMPEPISIFATATDL